MKKEWLWLIALSLCVALAIPWSILGWQKEKITANDVPIRVLLSDGKVKEFQLEDYLVGVVAAEMPVEFAQDALKAQAIAARTFAAKRLSQRNSSDCGYDVDTTVHTQAWLSDDQLKIKWGWLNYWRYRSRVQKVVAGTRGLVLVVNGDYIDAFYHSSSGRKPTERSEDVWSSPRSYLENVSSGEDKPDRYVKSFSFTPSELFKKFGLQKSPRSLTAGDIQIKSRTAAGRAKTVRLLGKEYAATELRTLLGLPSTDIEWVVRPESLTITAYGNGHALGMSQWGANDMAKKGKTYEEILAHFYPGTKIMALGYKQENQL